MMESRTAAGRQRALAGVVVAVICGLLLTATAATASSPSPAAPSPGASSGAVTYRVGVMEAVDNLNPFIGYSSTDYLIYHLNYDFLVSWDPKDLLPRPEFAESWSSSPDGKTWTFKIRSGMTWQDGEPATARDVAFTFNYIIDNQLGAYTMYLTYIQTVTAPDETTVVFECSKPKGDILQMSVPILPEHIWSKVSGKAAATSFTNGPPCVGSGPFQVVENKQNSYVQLVANKDYWRGAPHIDELLFETYQNADTMVQDLKAGTLDAAVPVPSAQFKGLAGNGITTNAATSWQFAQLSFNCYDSPDSKGNPVLLDPRFRQALWYAFDPAVIASVAYGGYLWPGGTLMPPYSQYQWQPPAELAYTFDPAKAKAMLDAAGYKDANGDGFRETKKGKPLALRLYAPADTPPDITTGKLLAGWFEDVGVKVRLEVLDTAALTSRIWSYSGDTFTPDYDMFTYFWLGGSDPNFILSLLTPGQIGVWSDTSWTDPRYTMLYDEQATAIDQQTRIGLVQQMQQIAYEASPYLVFGSPQLLQAYNTAKWEGYVKAPGNNPDYNGDAIYYADVIDSYLELRPVAAAPTSGGSSGTLVYAVIAVAAIVVIVIAVVVLRRRRRAEYEAGE